MARIAGVDLPRNKRVDIALMYIYGIGRTTAASIVEDIAIDPSTRIQDLTEDDLSQIRTKISSDYRLEGDLRREIDLDIMRLNDISSYRGLRHRRSLPVRGQRTSTNARTRKGKARTISVGRKAKEAGRKA